MVCQVFAVSVNRGTASVLRPNGIDYSGVVTRAQRIVHSGRQETATQAGQMWNADKRLSALVSTRKKKKL